VHQIDEGLGLPEPSSEDIRQLVKLTLKAGGFLPSPQGNGDRLSQPASQRPRSEWFFR